VGSVVTKKYKLGQKKPMTSLAFGQILNFLEYIPKQLFLELISWPIDYLCKIRFLAKLLKQILKLLYGRSMNKLDAGIGILPDEIHAHIFSFLDLKATAVAGQVCRRWKATSNDRLIFLWNRSQNPNFSKDTNEKIIEKFKRRLRKAEALKIYHPNENEQIPLEFVRKFAKELKIPPEERKFSKPAESLPGEPSDAENNDSSRLEFSKVPLIHRFCHTDRLCYLKLLIGFGFNIFEHATYSKIGENISTLHLTAYYSNYIGMELLLNRGYDANRTIPGICPPPIYFAINSESIEEDIIKTIETLIKHGASLNSEFKSNKDQFRIPFEITPLHELINGPKVETRGSPMVEFLVRHGADLNTLNEEKDTPLICMLKAIATYALEGASEDIAAISDRTKIFEEIALKLIELGARVDVINRLGASALFSAIISGNSRIYNALKEKGVSIINELSQGVDLKRAACLKGDVKVMKEILEVSSDVNRKYDNGDTLLMIASALNQVAMISLLVDYKAEVNAQNYSGETALHFGVKSGSPEVVSTLLQAGANKTLRDNKNRTPKQYAESKKVNAEIIQLLT
jgi:ankyrin repeat protein